MSARYRLYTGAETAKIDGILRQGVKCASQDDFMHLMFKKNPVMYQERLDAYVAETKLMYSDPVCQKGRE